MGVLFWLPACEPRSVCRAGNCRICTLSGYRKAGEKLLEKNAEITGVQKSAGASEYQRQTGDVLSFNSLLSVSFQQIICWALGRALQVFGVCCCL